MLFVPLSRQAFLGLIIGTVVNFLNFFKTCFQVRVFENKTPQAYLEPCETSEIEGFAKKGKDY